MGFVRLLGVSIGITAIAFLNTGHAKKHRLSKRSSSVVTTALQHKPFCSLLATDWVLYAGEENKKQALLRCFNPRKYTLVLSKPQWSCTPTSLPISFEETAISPKQEITMFATLEVGKNVPGEYTCTLSIKTNDPGRSLLTQRIVVQVLLPQQQNTLSEDKPLSPPGFLIADPPTGTNLDTPTLPFLRVEKLGVGTVVSKPAGLVDCGSLCRVRFSQPFTIKLEAIPSVGSTFQGWYGASCLNLNAHVQGQCILQVQNPQVLRVVFGRSKVRKILGGVLGTLAASALIGSVPFFVMHGKPSDPTEACGDPEHGIPPLVGRCKNNTAPIGGIMVGVSAALGVGTTFALWPISLRH